ncbi:MAG TPA: HAD-IA family hydrolase [Anaerolineae bacterium]|nr:HAD-IA family hydrolase [Anaerolineae bacterium]
MITYLIWDAGGTLFDTYPAIVVAAREALQTFGKVAPPSTVLSGLFRQTTAYGLQILAQEFNLDLVALRARFSAYYDAIGAAYQPPFPGVIEVCQYMLANGGQNFIVTHRERESLQQLLAAYEMADYFSDAITQEDDYPRKPDPLSLEILLERYALPRETGLVIGDRPLDIQAGKGAGLRTCFFGAADPSVPADLQITAYAELYRWLQQENLVVKRETSNVKREASAMNVYLSNPGV